jgi:hypothetical protein
MVASMLSPKHTIKTEKIGKRSWRVIEPFYEVPVGFVSNGADVPRPVWFFLDPAGEAFEASVEHDYELTIDTTRFKMSSHRKFKERLLQYEVAPWKAYVAFSTVCAYWFIKGLIK